MAERIHVIGNTVEFSQYDMARQNDDNILVFVGKMSYEPNIVAILNFVENVLPLVRKKVLDVKFYIVGANPHQKIRALNRIENVVVTGYVEDVVEYFKKATVVIAPMITGAGIQNKIIQAMSLGCCVLTTSIGAEGLVIRKKEIAIVNGNQEMADEIIRLLPDINRREAMGKAAREYVNENLSPEVVAEQFDAFIRDIDQEKEMFSSVEQKTMK